MGISELKQIFIINEQLSLGTRTIYVKYEHDHERFIYKSSRSFESDLK